MMSKMISWLQNLFISKKRRAEIIAKTSIETKLPSNSQKS